MKIISATTNDLEMMTRLHIKDFSKDHFIANFPVELLEKYYADLMQHYSFSYSAY